MLLPRLVVTAVAGWLPMAGQAAEPVHPVKPLLWKVEGQGMEKPSYLFGTMHLGDKAVVTLHPAAEKAFGEATMVHTEVALDMASQMESLQGMMRDDGKTLDAAIGAELAERLDEELKLVNPAFNAAPFQVLRTWVIAYMLPYLEEQMAGIKPLDLVLWERAVNEGKKTAGMQESKDQLVGFNELSDEEQTLFLTTVLDYMQRNREEGTDPIKEAIAIYLSGDADKVSALATDYLAELTGGKEAPLMEKLLKRILNDRDVIMADYIDATLKKNPEDVHFFAAGAGHYATKGGVPDKLVEKGYTVTRVEE